jgi:hypothetical protein
MASHLACPAISSWWIMAGTWYAVYFAVTVNDQDGFVFVSVRFLFDVHSTPPTWCLPTRTDLAVLPRDGPLRQTQHHQHQLKTFCSKLYALF